MELITVVAALAVGVVGFVVGIFVERKNPAIVSTVQADVAKDVAVLKADVAALKAKV